MNEPDINPFDFFGMMTERFATGTIQSSVESAELSIQAMRPWISEINTYSELLARLSGTKKLCIKMGMDPTSPDVTLGHVVPLLVARKFQSLGHKVTIIIGDYTAAVGDPSGVDKTRPILDADTIDRNAYTYIDQIGRIIYTDSERFEFKRNSAWLSRVNVVTLSSKKTVQQMLARDSFKQRFEKGQEIRIHEFLYPLFQGWDSVAIGADVEIGGTDQLFNMMVGRDLQIDAGKQPQCVLCTPLLVGLDGVQKMSKSKGNYIGVTDQPSVVYGKVMSLPDSAMTQYFSLLTSVAVSQFAKMIAEHPRDAKAMLARSIVELLHGAAAVEGAEDHFESLFRRHEIPEDMPEIRVREHPWEFPLHHLVSSYFYISKTQAIGKIREGAIRMDGQKVTDPEGRFSFKKPAVIQFGKRRFIRLIPESIAGTVDSVATTV